MYIFLKEYLNNEHVHAIFKEWSERKDRFEGRDNLLFSLLIKIIIIT